MNIPKDKEQAGYRKALYEYLIDQGFEVTPERQRRIKDIVAPIQPRQVQAIEQKPREHKVVCKNCGGTRLYVGKKPFWKKRWNNDEFAKPA